MAGVVYVELTNEFTDNVQFVGGGQWQVALDWSGGVGQVLAWWALWIVSILGKTGIYGL